MPWRIWGRASEAVRASRCIAQSVREHAHWAYRVLDLLADVNRYFLRWNPAHEVGKKGLETSHLRR